MNNTGGYKGILSRAFHGIFGVLWLLLMPGIILFCLVADSSVLIPILAGVISLTFFDEILDALRKLKAWAADCIARYPIAVIAVFFMSVQIVLQLYVGYEMAVTPSGDRNVIFKQASEMALNNVFKTSDKYNFYFLRYPNNQALLLLETVWFMILKSFGIYDFLHGNMILNIFAIDLSIIFCMIIVYKKYGKNSSVLFLAMTFLFIPFYTYIPFVYTDTLVLPMVTGLLLCYTFLEEYWNKGGIKFFFIPVLMGILAWLGFELKPTVLIIIIACFIHIAVTKNWKRGFICMILISLVFCTCFKTYNFVIDRIEMVDQTDYDKENFPYSHWIMMGLQGSGNFNLEDREYTSSFETKAEKEKGNIEMIRKRLKEYGAWGLFLHQYIKAVNTWSNGKYDMEFHLQRDPKKNTWLQNIFFKDGGYYFLYDGYCTAYQFLLLFLIAVSVIYGFRKRETDSAVMWKLALFGLFLFLSIWETKARYVLHFIPVMLLIAVDMLVKIRRSIVTVQPSIKCEDF